MARRPYDPLAFVPTPGAVHDKLKETLALADRLRALLELANKVRPPAGPPHPQGPDGPEGPPSPQAEGGQW